MTSVGVVDRSSLDVKSLGRKMIECWSEQNMRRGRDEVEGIERDNKRQESKVYKTDMRTDSEREREREREGGGGKGGREIERTKRQGAESEIYLAQGVDKHSLPLLLFLKVVARRLAHH